ncbi:DNA-binding response regulator [Pseudonocardia sp. MH-G8]|nr:DNA-binding response regulator [Pseudonocardia sp. MH-G8]
MQRTVLVVEDEPKIRALVRSYLERGGYGVLEAATAARALELAPGADLMILDLRLPDRDGEDVARQVRATTALPIIMVTAKADESQRIAGLRLGADDYVAKPFSPRELVARVDAVLRRAMPASDGAGPASFGDGSFRIDTEQREVWVRERRVTLTRTEFDLLTTLAARPGRVWSRLQLMARVQREVYETDERTIDQHVKNLRRKLGDRPPRLVLTVPGVGYKLGMERDA